MVPVQEQMGIYVDKIRKLHKTAGLLPAPLYVLFVQLEAYMNAADKHLTVTVEGDEDEAVALLSSGNKNEDPDDSDSDQEADPPEDLNEEKLRRHRKLSKADRQEERRKRLLLKHPLHIHLTIKLKGFGDYLTLNFYYLMNLNVVTVQCEVHLVQQIRGISAGDLLSPHMLLAALIPNDLGEDSPNAANYYQLRNVGLDKFASYVSELGHPYRWTQQMAGLNFLPANQSAADGEQTDLVKPDPEVSRACVPDLVKCIRSRFKARIALGRQVQDFEAGHVQILQTQKQAFPPRVSTTLTSWQPVIWNDYRQLNSTQRLVREKAVTEADTLYRAAFSRGSAKLIALIAVKPDHPKDPPVFSLNLHWNGEHNSNNDDAIRDMEREVNVHWRELISEPGWSWGLLSAQMYRLMACLDVYLEATCTRSVLPAEFPKERIFFSPVRGRTRSLPYKYIPAGGGRYTQR
ncbi:hypothetical protein B566_EDAN010278 [Ephemera danica]|nr:hypothetical protein B566_EDAN010278 [Ephemera danica]